MIDNVEKLIDMLEFCGFPTDKTIGGTWIGIINRRCCLFSQEYDYSNKDRLVVTGRYFINYYDRYTRKTTTKGTFEEMKEYLINNYLNKINKARSLV